MPDTPPPAGDASGLPRLARVRARLAQALARRASAHAGEVRRVLDAKLAMLNARPADSQQTTPAADAPRTSAPPLAPPGLLADLVDHAARQKAASVPGAAVLPRAAAGRHATGTAADPTTVQFFKRTWSRLSADRRLAQSRASLPDNAGPLNSHHLVHRALTLMRELSPEYLERFVGHVDALQWLEQSNEAAAHEATAAARPAAARRSLAARRR
jgi:hypothetical protein